MKKANKRKTKISPPMLLGHVFRQLLTANIWTLALMFFTIGSAFALIVLSHEQRKLYAEQEQLDKQYDDLDVELHKLKTELRVLADPSRLEEIATDDLGMKNLDLRSERIVKQVKDSD